MPQAAIAAYHDSPASTLSGRLIDALLTADQMGGDLRGRQSAALHIVAGDHDLTRSLPDLCVDDSRDPVGELSRLHRLWQAHELLRASRDGDGLYRDLAALQTALALAPDDQACLGAAALAFLRAGDRTAAAPILERLANREPRTANREPNPSTDR